MATTRTNNSTADETTKKSQDGKNENDSTPRKTTRSKTSAKATTAKTRSTTSKATGTKATSTKAKSTAKPTTAKSSTTRAKSTAKSTKSGTSTSRASSTKSKEHENPIQAAVSDIRHEVGRIEKGIERTWREEISVAGNQLVDRVKELAEDGTALRLRVKHDGKVLVEIPLAAAVVGSAITVLAAPILAAVAAIGGAVARVTLEVERKGTRSKASSKK